MLPIQPICRFPRCGLFASHKHDIIVGHIAVGVGSSGSVGARIFVASCSFMNCTRTMNHSVHGKYAPRKFSASPVRGDIANDFAKRSDRREPPGIGIEYRAETNWRFRKSSPAGWKKIDGGRSLRRPPVSSTKIAAPWRGARTEGIHNSYACDRSKSLWHNVQVRDPPDAFGAGGIDFSQNRAIHWLLVIAA